jgi:beta-galactosidase
MLESWQGSEIKADVAILFSFENEYAFQIQPQTEGYYYFEQLQRLHRAFSALGLNVDVIGQHESLAGYRIVCAPEMYVHSDGVQKRLQAFAEAGGTVLLTTRSGVKDASNNACMAQLPGIYREMAGVHAAEYVPIGWDSVPIRFEDGTELTAKQWCDVLEPDTAQVLARYDGDYFAGAAAITLNRCGDGRVYYIGTVGMQPLYDRMAALAAAEAGLPVFHGLPERVEVTTRTNGNATARFLFNNDDKPKTFSLEGQEMTLAPFEMKIITI